MIYFYQTISPHKIERLQNYLHYFFTKLFAEVHPTYDHAHCIEANFQTIVNSYTPQVDDKLRAIYTAYMRLKPNPKLVAQTAYANNNNIDGICSGAIKPYKYSELPKGIRASIKNLYNELWDSVLGYARVEDNAEHLKNISIHSGRKIKTAFAPFVALTAY